MCRSTVYRALLPRSLRGGLLQQRERQAPAVNPQALWGCRRAPGVEYVLDYMVERKRCDDLVSSVRDQRYAAQKYRMRQSRLRNLFYLLEGDPDITCEPALASRWLLLQQLHPYFKLTGVGDCNQPAAAAWLRSV